MGMSFGISSPVSSLIFVMHAKVVRTLARTAIIMPQYPQVPETIAPAR